jgi:hypothetical protein
MTLSRFALLVVGAMAAACDDEEEDPPPPPPFLGPFDAADSGLPVFPLDRLSCAEGGGEYCSYCCERFLCYRPEPGTPCAQPRSGYITPLTDLEDSYGNWTCQSRGPFDPVAGGERAGDCCYVISTQYCI